MLYSNWRTETAPGVTIRFIGCFMYVAKMWERSSRSFSLQHVKKSDTAP
jgi:hypothetical protein